MKAEEIENIKNAAQGMSLNDVVDCINYLETSSRLVENQRDSFYDKWVKAESQLNEEREKNKNLVELLNRSKGWFSGIQDKVAKINTGNISHQKATIIGFAKRCREFLTLRCREFLTLNHK
jgi:hypothetical protein